MMKISLSFPSPHRSNSSLFHHHHHQYRRLSFSFTGDGCVVCFNCFFFVNFNLSPLCIEKYFLRCFLSVLGFFSFFLLFPSIGNVCLLLFCRVSFEPLLFFVFSLNVFEFCSCCLKVLRRFMRRFLEDCPFDGSLSLTYRSSITFTLLLSSSLSWQLTHHHNCAALAAMCVKATL